VVLAATILARYSFQLAGAWRWIYVVGAELALYLNVFVLIVQSFQSVSESKSSDAVRAAICNHTNGCLDGFRRCRDWRRDSVQSLTATPCADHAADLLLAAEFDPFAPNLSPRTCHSPSDMQDR